MRLRCDQDFYVIRLIGSQAHSLCSFAAESGVSAFLKAGLYIRCHGVLLLQVLCKDKFIWSPTTMSSSLNDVSELKTRCFGN